MLSRTGTALIVLTVEAIASVTQARPTVIQVDHLVNGSWNQLGSTHDNGSSFTIADV
jgi:hypothetical protein